VWQATQLIKARFSG